MGGLAVLMVDVTRPTAKTQRSVSGDNAPRPVTEAEYERWQTELSNWGRWGKDDELGALNLITPAKRRAAAALVREGATVSLASIAHTQKAVDVPCPNEWAMVTASEVSAVDRIAYPCIHGAGTTHIDAFAHRFIGGKMWNGYPVAGLVTSDGAARNSVLTMKDGIVTRGVLYDIPHLKGVPYLEPGTRIFPEDLEAWERKAGVRVGSGDALLLRWGRWARRQALGPWPVDQASAGLDVSVIPWMKRRDIAILGWETPSYAGSRTSAGCFGARFRVDDPGSAFAGPGRLRGIECSGRSPQSVGVHVDHRTVADSQRDGFTRQPHSCLLTTVQARDPIDAARGRPSSLNARQWLRFGHSNRALAPHAASRRQSRTTRRAAWISVAILATACVECSTTTSLPDGRRVPLSGRTGRLEKYRAARSSQVSTFPIHHWHV